MTDYSMKRTGNIIKELREKAGESQEQLAIALNAPNRETITRWENGARDLKREHIIAIAQHFNVSTDYLLGLSDIQTTDTDIQNACKVTGLSEPAVVACSAIASNGEFKNLIRFLNALLIEPITQKEDEYNIQNEPLIFMLSDYIFNDKSELITSAYKYIFQALDFGSPEISIADAKNLYNKICLDKIENKLIHLKEASEHGEYNTPKE